MKLDGPMVLHTPSHGTAEGQGADSLAGTVCINTIVPNSVPKPSKGDCLVFVRL